MLGVSVFLGRRDGHQCVWFKVFEVRLIGGPLKVGDGLIIYIEGKGLLCNSYLLIPVAYAVGLEGWTLDWIGWGEGVEGERRGEKRMGVLLQKGFYSVEGSKGGGRSEI